MDDSTEDATFLDWREKALWDDCTVAIDGRTPEAADKAFVTLLASHQSRQAPAECNHSISLLAQMGSGFRSMSPGPLKGPRM